MSSQGSLNTPEGVYRKMEPEKGASLPIHPPKSSMESAEEKDELITCNFPFRSVKPPKLQIGIFIKQVFYHTFAPFSIPIMIWIDGKQQAINQGFWYPSRKHFSFMLFFFNYLMHVILLSLMCYGIYNIKINGSTMSMSEVLYPCLLHFLRHLMVALKYAYLPAEWMREFSTKQVNGEDFLSFLLLTGWVNPSKKTVFRELLLASIRCTNIRTEDQYIVLEDSCVNLTSPFLRHHIVFGIDSSGASSSVSNPAKPSSTSSPASISASLLGMSPRPSTLPAVPSSPTMFGTSVAVPMNYAGSLVSPFGRGTPSSTPGPNFSNVLTTPSSNFLSGQGMFAVSDAIGLRSRFVQASTTLSNMNARLKMDDTPLHHNPGTEPSTHKGLEQSPFNVPQSCTIESCEPRIVQPPWLPRPRPMISLRDLAFYVLFEAAHVKMNEKLGVYMSLMFACIPFAVRAGAGEFFLGASKADWIVTIPYFFFTSRLFSAAFVFLMVGVQEYRRRSKILHWLGHAINPCDRKEKKMPLIDVTVPSNIAAWSLLRRICELYGVEYRLRLQAYASFVAIIMISMVIITVMELLSGGLQSVQLTTMIYGIILVFVMSYVLLRMLGFGADANETFVEHESIIAQRKIELQNQCATVLRGLNGRAPDSALALQLVRYQACMGLMDSTMERLRIASETEPVTLLGAPANLNTLRVAFSALATVAGMVIEYLRRLKVAPI